MKYPFEYVEAIEKKFEVAFFIDLETTGLDAMRNEILTASVSVCDYKTLEQIDEIDLTFCPRDVKFWDEGAEKIHGIKLQTALAFPDAVEQSRELMRFFLKYKREGTQPLVSHALNFRGSYFDQNFLMMHFLKLKEEAMYTMRRVCGISQSTIDFAKAANLGVQNYKLSTLAEYYQIELDHHNAKSDRQACQTIYKRLREREA
jgi:DNA polymerase III epsilon subunit-like protein